MKTRLGKRLKALLNALPKHPHTVWDLCCDHGALGRAVLEVFPQCHVVFNDIHPDIMQRLEQLLEHYQASNYSTLACPAQSIQPQPGTQPVFILAGVGDEQCIEILSHLGTCPEAESFTYIISPATKVAYVRKYLIDQHFRLLSDKVVSENGRSYEIITACQSPKLGRALSERQGDHIGTAWEADTIQLQHLQKLKTFYTQQAGANKNHYAMHLAYSYEKKLLQLTAASSKLLGGCEVNQ